MQSTAAIAECFQRAAPAGSDLYYATLWCEERTRAQIISVHALVDELISIACASSDPGVARIKLAWWKEELAGTINGGGSHAISIALRATGAISDADDDSLLACADVCSGWLTPRRFPDSVALYSEYRSLEGVLWQHTARLLGVADAGVLDAAAVTGIAIGMTQTLQHFRECLKLPTVRLAEDALTTHGLTVDSLREAAKPSTLEGVADDLATYIRSLADNARDAFGATRQHQLLPLQIMLELKLRALDEMQSDGFALLQRRVVLTPLHKLWIAMRCRYRIRRRPTLQL